MRATPYARGHGRDGGKARKRGLHEQRLAMGDRGRGDREQGKDGLERGMQDEEQKPESAQAEKRCS